MPTLRRSSTTKPRKSKSGVRKTKGRKGNDLENHGPLPTLLSELLRVGFILAKNRF